MKVLVACEESQRVTTEFRNMGIEAFSCDILDPSEGLPPLEPTDIVEPEPRQILSSGKTMPRWYSNCGGDRKKNRAKTFPGIAKQIAQQWGTYVLNERG